MQPGLSIPTPAAGLDPNRYAPLRRARRPFPSHWLVAIGLVGAVSCLAMWVFSPGLFLVAAPLMLLCLALAGVAGIASFLNPPAWAHVGLIVFAFALMDFSLRKGGVSAGGFDAQSIFKGLVWVVVLAYAALHGGRHLLRHPLPAWLTLYAVLALLSASYSPSQLLGLGSGVALLAIGLYAGLISQFDESRLHRLWRAMFGVVALLALASLITYFAAPGWARDYLASGAGRLRGVNGSGNSLAAILCIGLIAGAYVLERSSRWSSRGAVLVGVAVVVASLILTESRGSTAGLLAAFIVVAAIGRPLVALGAALIGLFSLWLLLQPGLFDAWVQWLAGVVARSGSADEITSFTGRSDIWLALWPKVLESPWIGYGLGGARVVVSQAYSNQWGQSYESAHNWLLESLLSVGVIGTVVLAGFLVGVLVSAWRLRKRLLVLPDHQADAALVRCILRCWVFLLVSGMVEKSFAGMPSPSTVLFALMAGSCASLHARLAAPVATPRAS